MTHTFRILAALWFSVAEVYSKPSIEPTTFSDDGARSFQFTCTDALLPGEVLAWYRSTDVVTDDTITFREFFPVTDGLVQFRVRSNIDVYVGLLPGTTQDRKPLYYEVILGGWKNTRSSIRREKKYQMYAEDTPNIVTDCEYRGFWVRLDDGTISVGYEGQRSPFMWWRDPSPLPVAYYSFSGYGGSVGFWKTKESGYPEDELLAMTQLLEPLSSPTNGKKVELVLNKSRERARGRGAAPSVYCAKHLVLPGGAFSKGVESNRVPLTYTANTSLEQPFVKVEPYNASVYFTASSALTLSCSGSLPVDGRTYTWLRKDSRQTSVTIPKNQTYDAVNNVNVLHLLLDESYDGHVLYCCQAYSSPVQFNGFVLETKTYGVLAQSENITLFMKKQDDVVKKEPEIQVTKEPQNPDVVTKEPERQDVVTKEPERQDEVTKEPERQDVVTKEPEHQDVVTKEPERQDVVTKEPERQDVVTKEPERQDIVTKEPERQAPPMHSCPESRTDVSCPAALLYAALAAAAGAVAGAVAAAVIAAGCCGPRACPAAAPCAAL